MKFNHISPLTTAIFVLALLIPNLISASSWTEVQTLEGKFTTLSEQFEQDKWTLVMFWTTDCSICRREYPAMSEFHNKYKDTKAKVVGVSLDGYSDIDEIKSHIDEMPITFDNLIGDISVIAFNYQAATEEAFRGTPTFLMFNPQGQLVAHNPGPVTVEILENFINRK